MDNREVISLVDRAVGFAARAHEGQKRKSGDIPFIAHPVGVALLLQQMGCEETVVAAGLLHDTVEDTKITLEDIRQSFGDEVADIVAGCTEPPRKRGNWEDRKRYLVRTLSIAPISVKLVAAADKYHNLSHLLNGVRNEGSSVWNNFGKGVQQQAWYYRSVLDSLKANVPDPDQYPIFEELEDVVNELFDGIQSREP